MASSISRISKGRLSPFINALTVAPPASIPSSEGFRRAASEVLLMDLDGPIFNVYTVYVEYNQ
jgi:hypothetical protein